MGAPLQLARTYNSMDVDTGLGLKPGGGTYGFGKWFGVGWSSTYEINMIFDQVLAYERGQPINVENPDVLAKVELPR